MEEVTLPMALLLMMLKKREPVASRKNTMNILAFLVTLKIQYPKQFRATN